jgi:hypothetical protein
MAGADENEDEEEDENKTRGAEEMRRGEDGKLMM